MQKPQTKDAAPAAPTPANTAESLGWQLRGALPPMRLHSVSLCDATGDVVWLSEGALGPDEHGFIMEALDTLGADPSLAYCESDLEDGRGAVFLAVRAPTGDLVGVVMILADIKSLSGGAASRILIAPIRAVLQRMAILLRPANSATQTVPVLGMGRSPAAPVVPVAVTPVQINTPAPNPQPSAPPESSPSAASPAPKSATVLEFVPPSEDVLDFNPEEISIAAAPSEPEREATQTLSPQAVDDILSFELSDIPIARPVVRPAPIVPVADLPAVQEAPPVADEAPPVVEPPVVREVPSVAREVSPPTVEPASAPRETVPPVVREAPSVAREVSPPTLEPASAPNEAEPPVVREAPPAAREISPPAPEPASAPPPETVPPVAREIPPIEPVAAPKHSKQPKVASASTAEVMSLRDATVTTDTVPDLIEIPAAPEAIASTGTMTVVEQQPPVLSEVANEPSVAESVATESTGNTPAPVVDVPTLSAVPDSKAAEQPNDVLVAPLTRLRAGGRTQRFVVSLRDPANAVSARKQSSSVDLDEWQYPEAVIVDEVCSWLAAHAHIRESTPLNLLIRVSAQAIEDTQFTDLIASHLSMNDIPPATIAFMLPESLCVSHRARAEKFVTACEKLGCGIVIDEFTLNSGAVSFLRSKALRMVIVDSKLTTSAMKDKVSQALVIAICQASKVLGIHCTATGVDTSIARRWLTAIGFDFAQGKIFDGPRPIESLANAEAPK